MSTGELWSRYVRYIGAGAVAVAGIITVLRNLPTMASALRGVFTGLRTVPQPAESASAVRIPGRVENREEGTHLSGSLVVSGFSVVVFVVALVPGARAACVALGPRRC